MTVPAVPPDCPTLEELEGERSRLEPHLRGCRGCSIIVALIDARRDAAGRSMRRRGDERY